MNAEEPNLYTHIKEVREAAMKDDAVSVIIYCGKVKTDADVPAGLQTHTKIIEDEVNNEEVNITGILIGQGTSILHLIEAPCNSILRIMTLLSQSEQLSGASATQVGRIILSIEDKPSRHFTSWNSTIIPEKKSSSDDVNDENCVSLVEDLSARLMDVGIGLQSEANSDVEFTRYADLLPGKNLVVSLASSELFFDVHDFVDCYCSAYSHELQSEMTWPLQPLVSYS